MIRKTLSREAIVGSIYLVIDVHVCARGGRQRHKGEANATLAVHLSSLDSQVGILRVVGASYPTRKNEYKKN